MIFSIVLAHRHDNTSDFIAIFVVGLIIGLILSLVIKWIRTTNQTQNITHQIKNHFSGYKLEQLITIKRQFPARVRADLQRSFDQLFKDKNEKQYKSFSCDYMATFSGLALVTYPINSTPPRYEEVEIGEEEPVRCLKNGIWLCKEEEKPYALLLIQPEEYHEDSYGNVCVEIAYPPGKEGEKISNRIFEEIEKGIRISGCYRGKVVSLERKEAYSGQSTGVCVHHLNDIKRDQIILPEKTLSLIERNIIRFIDKRQKLISMGQSAKKGVLFWGSPGTGKTHTLHYLAQSLTEHTTLLITAEQVALLQEYITLARLWQPSIVVIEDVDLIAKERTTIGSTYEQSLLHRLLNEMDGLRQDAEILFLLTTNHPDALEEALCARPGRVDQAIEFPLPDDECRRKLVTLYSKDLKINDEIIEEFVKRTDSTSPAFIKETVRRSIQFAIEEERDEEIHMSDVQNALTDIVDLGGKLNRKLLGGSTNMGF